MPARSTPSASALVLRALPTLDALPAGAIAHPVADTTAAPHLLPGDFAVVDTADREPTHGELYVIRYTSPVTDSGLPDRVHRGLPAPLPQPGRGGRLALVGMSLTSAHGRGSNWRRGPMRAGPSA